MGITSKFIINIIGACLFVSALIFFTYNLSTLSKMESQSDYTNSTNDFVYETELDEIEEPTVSTAQLYAILSQPLEYDIKIEEISFKIDEDINMNELSEQIPNGNYFKNYQYDDYGTIYQIVFTKTN